MLDIPYIMYGGKTTVLANHNNQLYCCAIVFDMNCCSFLETNLLIIAQHKHMYIVECVHYIVVHMPMLCYNVESFL